MLAGRVLPLVRCLGPPLTAASTADVNRAQPSGRNSILGSFTRCSLMATEPTSYPPTEDHYRAFGGIVQQFARHERLIERAIARMLGAGIGATSIVTSGLGYLGKRDALLSLIKLSTMPKSNAENIIGFLDKLHSRNGLRNAIAHNVWKAGEREGSIKPLGLTARGGTGKIRGLRKNEPDYTARDLLKIATELTILHNSFRDYLQSVDLM